MSRNSFSAARSSSASMSGAEFISHSDANSVSSLLETDTESYGVADRFATMHLGQDLPLPSIEGSSSETSGGVNLSRPASHSRTPSLSISPPVPESSESRASPRREMRGGSSDSLIATDSIDNRLGMSQVAAALESVAVGHDGSRVLLDPERPVSSNGSSRRRGSRRRSSSNNQTTPYQVAEEELPHDPFHEPTFQLAFSDAKRAMSRLTNVLSGSSLSNETDSTMKRLFDEGRNLAQFQCPPTRILGFVGDSGAGKSSLLNSLLDFKGLARTSNSGEACTCVATEYRFHDSDGFAIEVEWFSMDDIFAQLTELLQSYRRYHISTAGEDQQDRQDRQQFEDRAKVARDTFRAMFRGRLGDEKFLTLLSEANVMQTLNSWAADVRSISEVSREEYRSAEECSTLLMQLTSEDNSTQGPAKWPYIRKIKVFLRAHILNKGLVLVDLPGLRDSNSARRNITEQYLLQCDEIFAICNIGRAASDASVVSIFDLARQAKLNNVAIICTKSDDIKAEEAIRDWHGEKAREIRIFLDKIAIDRRDVENIQLDLDEYANDDDLSEEEKEDLSQLNRRSKQAKERKEQHEFELKKYLVNTRNAEVNRSLYNIYHNKLPENNLKVFCISNTEYWDHRELQKNSARPYLELSGIPAIRKYCISMVADRQLRIAKKYIQDDIPALLGDIELWVQSGAGSVDAEQRETIRETLHALETRLNRELIGNNSLLNGIARSFRLAFRGQISGILQIADWTRAASNTSKVWSTWPHGSYSAFCRKFGDHCTEAQGSHNWNEEAIEQMAIDLGGPWETLKTSLHRDLAGHQTWIEELMNWAVEYLVNELQESSKSADTVSEAMVSRQHLLLEDIKDICEDFEKDLRTLRTIALSGVSTSLIRQLLKSAYDECNNEKGRGSDARRKAIIARKLEDEATLESLLKSFRIFFGDRVDSLQDEIQAVITTHLTTVKNTLDILRNENVALESEREPAFRAQVEREVRLVNDEISRIKDVIKS